MRQRLGEGGLGPEGEEIGGIDDLARRTLVHEEYPHRFLGEFVRMEEPDRRLAVGPQGLLGPVVDFDRLLEIDAIESLRRGDHGRAVGLTRQCLGLRGERVEIEGFRRRKLERRGVGVERCEDQRRCGDCAEGPAPGQCGRHSGRVDRS